MWNPFKNLFKKQNKKNSGNIDNNSSQLGTSNGEFVDNTIDISLADNLPQHDNIPNDKVSDVVDVIENERDSLLQTIDEKILEHILFRGDIDINDVVPSNVLDKEYGATMAQSTDSAINSGAGNHLGHIDVNFSTVDYTDQDIVYENDLYDIKEFERNDGELLAMFGGGATAGIAILAAGAIIGKKKKQKGTRNSYRPQQK